MNIITGNTSGTGFSQQRFDFLTTLAQSLNPGIQQIVVWYDDTSNFHCMDITCQDCLYQLRYYKLLSMKTPAGWQPIRETQLRAMFDRLGKAKTV